MTPAGPELTQLKVVDLHSITVDELSGLAPLNWALRYLLEVVIRRNKARLINILEDHSRAYVVGALKMTPGAAKAVDEIDREMLKARTEQELIDSSEFS
ncbi:hypothetical protein BIW11_04063 [Tropilaelaps mercedesae]|uniref:Uncharacterized protein n=1 Tax=Tropilaelaps mercedesae TaxID=418985 RepID=A0A1V9XBQ2_9ACAR|nr:hypothetical protein BIW11_04063 [Tropilaelaps mercedesae]